MTIARFANTCTYICIFLRKFRKYFLWYFSSIPPSSIPDHPETPAHVLQCHTMNFLLDFFTFAIHFASLGIHGDSFLSIRSGRTTQRQEYNNFILYFILFFLSLAWPRRGKQKKWKKKMMMMEKTQDVGKRKITTANILGWLQRVWGKKNKNVLLRRRRHFRVFNGWHYPATANPGLKAWKLWAATAWRKAKSTNTTITHLAMLIVVVVVVIVIVAADCCELHRKSIKSNVPLLFLHTNTLSRQRWTESERMCALWWR